MKKVRSLHFNGFCCLFRPELLGLKPVSIPISRVWGCFLCVRSRWSEILDNGMPSSQREHSTNLNRQSISCWWTASMSALLNWQSSYLHLILGSFSNIFSTARFLDLVSLPWQTGQSFPSFWSGSWHLLQNECPVTHWGVTDMTTVSVIFLYFFSICLF